MLHVRAPNAALASVLLDPEELAKLAAYIARHDKPGRDEQIDEDFFAGRTDAAAFEKFDAEIDEGRFTPMP